MSNLKLFILVKMMGFKAQKDIKIDILLSKINFYADLFGRLKKISNLCY